MIPVHFTAAFCHSDEENGHHACMNGYLTTADQSEIRKANLVSVIATRKMEYEPKICKRENYR